MPVSRSTNHLLQRLPPIYRRSLLADMEEVFLPANTVLIEGGAKPEYAHFVLSGVVSFVESFENGDSVEVFSVGCEGLVEAAHLLGKANSSARAVVQIESWLARIRFHDLQVQFVEYAPLRTILQGYVQTRTFILEQLTACNRYHEVEERLARWLLMTQDKIGESSLQITQELLAEVLGTRRTTVTRAARRLQAANAIEYSRGTLGIRDRKALERKACECYSIVRALASESH